MVDIQLSDAEKTFIIHGVQVKAFYIKKRVGMSLVFVGNT